MKKLSTLFLLAFFLCINMYAQTVTPFALASSGTFFANSGGMLSSTTAEMTLVETFSNGGSILTQGFQQIWDLGVVIPLIRHHPFNYLIFPNPGQGIFILELDSSHTGRYFLEVYNLPGELIMKTETDILRYEIDLSKAAPGIYFAKIFNDKYVAIQSLIKQ